MLAEASHKDPYDQNEITAALAQLRHDYGFTELSAERVGEQWRLHARMSPEPPKESATLVDATGPTASATPVPTASSPTAKPNLEPEMDVYCELSPLKQKRGKVVELFQRGGVWKIFYKRRGTKSKEKVEVLAYYPDGRPAFRRENTATRSSLPPTRSGRKPDASMRDRLSGRPT